MILSQSLLFLSNDNDNINGTSADNAILFGIAMEESRSEISGHLEVVLVLLRTISKKGPLDSCA